jgi:hypothetical protein
MEALEVTASLQENSPQALDNLSDVDCSFYINKYYEL